MRRRNVRPAWQLGLLTLCGAVALSCHDGVLSSGVDTESEEEQPFASSVMEGNGLKGEYFDNRDLTGLALTRIDPRVVFDWGQGSPDPAIGADTFSVRWTGRIRPPASGTYSFYTRSDDGVRLWIDGKLLIDNWTNHRATLDRATATLAAGTFSSLRMEYFERSGVATAKLYYRVPGGSRVLIPSHRLFLPEGETPPPATATDAGVPPKPDSGINADATPETDGQPAVDSKPAGSCVPTTCAAQGKSCGSIPNGCGGTLSCGSCTAPATCGGGGVANVCGTATGASTGAVPTTVGWRSSDYGMEDPQAACQGPGAYGGACTVQPSYWVNAAKAMAAKFPGSQPGGIYTVGYIDNMGTAMPSQLQGVLGTMNAVHYSGAGKQADPEVMLSAFDAGGLKIVLAIEPGNADINVLATKILGKYKHHPSVIGFGMDNEWYKTESGNVKMTAAEATTFRDTIEAVNPNYVTVIKHYDASMLPKGIARVIYLTDTCNFNSLADAVNDYVAWANSFSGNRVGYQFGYDLFEVGSPDDQKWWGPLGTGGQPAVTITNAILAQRPGTDIFMIYWADFTMKTQFPLP